MTRRPRGSSAEPVLHLCGDTAILLDLDDNSEVHRWADAVRQARLPGVVEVVPGLTTLLVQVDPALTDLDSLAAGLWRLEPGDGTLTGAAERVIDVRYDGEDFEDVCEMTGLSRDEVVAAHTGSQWRVAFCGFAPGFSYLIGGDPRLQVPRRAESRVRVPAGAVALAGPFTSIYPRASPGGWQLIGTTSATLWCSDADTPAVLTPGTVVRFRRVDP